LRPQGDRLLPSDLRQQLRTRLFGRRIYYYPEVDSTNRAAADLARSGEVEGTLVVAEFQTRGRGRGDHTWSSPAGKDLLFTILLRPEGAVQYRLPVTLVFSLGVSRVLSEALGVAVVVDWPNDLVIDGLKIGGILAEGSAAPGTADFVVVGFGVNVNSERVDFPESIRAGVTSCRVVAGHEWDRAPLLAAILGATEAGYERFRSGGFAELRAEYEEKLVAGKRRVMFERKGTRKVGVVEGVSDDGALRVRIDDGEEVEFLYSETVTLLP